MAGVTRLELATSGVTGQRSNQLSYTPDWEGGKLRHVATSVNGQKVIRATDAKEVGVENPSEETFCRPNQRKSVSGQSVKVWPKCQLTIQLKVLRGKISRDIRVRIRIFPRPSQVDPFV